MRHLQWGAGWEADAVRDDVTGHLGDPGPVLVAEETGDIKKGACTAGVQAQYSGTAGRTGNCQVAVYLTYAAPRGHALTGRELYLPASWAGDPLRCQAAGIPAGTPFATRPALARRAGQRGDSEHLAEAAEQAAQVAGVYPELAEQVRMLGVVSVNLVG